MSSADGNGWILASNAITDPPNDGHAIFKWSPREGDVDGIIAEHFQKDGEQRQPTEQMSAGEGARVLRLKPFTPIRLLEVTPRDTGQRRQEEQVGTRYNRDNVNCFMRSKDSSVVEILPVLRSTLFYIRFWYPDELTRMSALSCTLLCSLLQSNLLHLQQCFSHEFLVS